MNHVACLTQLGSTLELPSWSTLAAALRSRRACRVADASGVYLASWTSLAERYSGHISGFDPRMCVYDPDRVEAASMRREGAMFARAIERYLSAIADAADIIASIEANALPPMVEAWMRSRNRTRVLRGAPEVAAAMRRASQSQDLHREYGAARRLADFAALYEMTLFDYCTNYSLRIAPSIP